jgi:hypothetical protein
MSLLCFGGHSDSPTRLAAMEQRRAKGTEVREQRGGSYLVPYLALSLLVVRKTGNSCPQNHADSFSQSNGSLITASQTNSALQGTTNFPIFCFPISDFRTTTHICYCCSYHLASVILHADLQFIRPESIPPVRVSFAHMKPCANSQTT